MRLPAAPGHSTPLAWSAWKDLGNLRMLVIRVLESVGLAKSHIERDAGYDRLPGLVARHPPTFDRAPKPDDLFFCDAVKKIVVGPFVDG